MEFGKPKKKKAYTIYGEYYKMFEEQWWEGIRMPMVKNLPVSSILDQFVSIQPLTDGYTSAPAIGNPTINDMWKAIEECQKEITEIKEENKKLREERSKLWKKV